MLFQKLDDSHVDALGEFFERNAQAAIERQFNPFPLNRSTASDLLNPARKDVFFGIFIESKIVAFSMLRGADEGYAIPSFGILVDSERHKRGIGKYLMRWTLLWADQGRIDTIRLSVFEDNESAVNLYQSLRFEKVEQSIANGRTQWVMTRQRPRERTALYVSLLALRPDEPIEQRLTTWKRAGLNHIEATWYPVHPDSDPSVFFERPGGIIHHYFPPQSDDPVLNLASPCPQVRERAQSFFRESIERSHQIGAPWFSLHAGFIVDPDGRDEHGFTFPVPSPEERAAALARFSEALCELQAEAKAKSVTLLVENNVCTN